MHDPAVEVHQLHNTSLHLRRLGHVLRPSELWRSFIAFAEETLELLLDLIHFVLRSIGVIQKVLPNLNEILWKIGAVQKGR